MNHGIHRHEPRLSIRVSKSSRLVGGTLAVAALTVVTSAHDFSASESVLEIDGATVRSRLSINLLELPGVDSNGDGRISYDELDNAIERVFGAIKEHYVLAAPDPPSAIVADRSDIVDDHVLQMVIRYSFGHSVDRLEVTSTLDRLLGAGHQHLASMKIDGEFQRDVLDPAHPSAHFDARRVTTARIAIVVVAALGLLAWAWLRVSGQKNRASTSRR
jgi:hypothetical protein